MAPRRKSSHELRAVQARVGRIRAREKQERVLLAKPGVSDFLAAVRQEHESYPSRCVAGETICRELSGAPFDWRAGHLLSDARDLAVKVNDEECAAFLDILANGASRNHYIDPLVAQSVEALVYALAPEDFTFWYWSVFRLVDFFGSKTGSGEYIYTDRADFNFESQIPPILDQANEVLRAANLPYLR